MTDEPNTPEVGTWRCGNGHTFEVPIDHDGQAPGVPTHCFVDDANSGEPCLDSSTLEPLDEPARRCAAAMSAPSARTYEGARHCVFCGNSTPLEQAEAEEHWTTVQLGSDDYHRCPGCTAEDRLTPLGQEDAPERPVFAAINEGLERAVERIEEMEGVKVLAAATFIHVEGHSPSAAMAVVADEDIGPENPREMLEFLLAGVQQFANANDIPLAFMETGGGAGIGGQG